MLEEVDRRILNRMQAEVPLAGRPFAAMGEELGVTEEEVMERVKRMKGGGGRARGTAADFGDF